jgi:hypothetical protein
MGLMHDLHGPRTRGDAPGLYRSPRCGCKYLMSSCCCATSTRRLCDLSLLPSIILSNPLVRRGGSTGEHGQGMPLLGVGTRATPRTRHARSIDTPLKCVCSRALAKPVPPRAARVDKPPVAPKTHTSETFNCHVGAQTEPSANHHAPKPGPISSVILKIFFSRTMRA